MSSPSDPVPVTPECPRCSAPVARLASDAVVEPRGATHACPEHGATRALRRAPEVSYDGFARHLLATADAFPTLLPWPLSPGWRVTDFASVGGADAPTAATLTSVAGSSQLDGPVDLTVVVEEPGTGLGARCAGLGHTDPWRGLGAHAPLVRVRVGRSSVPLWPVSTAALDGDLDRSVVAGEAGGRWLWLVVRPASAILLLRDDWILRDVSGVGPPLVELPFGGPGPRW
ncbi:hypothetical protein K8Z61_06715 [Nocardioides sp. TRM66260-LWL]|uniref:DUF6758 family protein n=1 Tax=Nocardioides sp. TRM66260-LWL TaxID=2874478 RepID=UPI001CC7C922|nr:DUF6758 family protein [Nocardioides sp. TRM66260-LWL]MBZ5734184.1 hypothetical protein [Nocardioides sp. TRM66260-LWL]